MPAGMRMSSSSSYIFMKYIVLFFVLFSPFCAFAQLEDVYHASIYGKWRSSKDKRSVLVFENEMAYHYYAQQKKSTYRFYMLQKDRDELLLMVDQEFADTTLYQVYNITSYYLTIRSITHKDEPMWALEKEQ